MTFGVQAMFEDTGPSTEGDLSMYSDENTSPYEVCHGMSYMAVMGGFAKASADEEPPKGTLEEELAALESVRKQRYHLYNGLVQLNVLNLDAIRLALTTAASGIASFALARENEENPQDILDNEIKVPEHISTAAAYMCSAAMKLSPFREIVDVFGISLLMGLMDTDFSPEKAEAYLHETLHRGIGDLLENQVVEAQIVAAFTINIAFYRSNDVDVVTELLKIVPNPHGFSPQQVNAYLDHFVRDNTEAE